MIASQPPSLMMTSSLTMSAAARRGVPIARDLYSFVPCLARGTPVSCLHIRSALSHGWMLIMGFLPSHPGTGSRSRSASGDIAANGAAPKVPRGGPGSPTPGAGPVAGGHHVADPGMPPLGGSPAVHGGGPAVGAPAPVIAPGCAFGKICAVPAPSGQTGHAGGEFIELVLVLCSGYILAVDHRDDAELGAPYFASSS